MEVWSTLWVSWEYPWGVSWGGILGRVPQLHVQKRATCATTLQNCVGAVLLGRWGVERALVRRCQGAAGLFRWLKT
jgi:hypothetical protein